jgi:phospholipid transport system transporter-binding protein
MRMGSHLEMSEAQLISVTEGELRLLGVVDYDNAPLLAPQIDYYLNASKPALAVDMSQVTHIDSAGMALLIDWFKKAQRKGVILQFCHVPSQLARIAALTQADKILNLM